MKKYNMSERDYDEYIDMLYEQDVEKKLNQIQDAYELELSSLAHYGIQISVRDEIIGKSEIKNTVNPIIGSFFLWYDGIESGSLLLNESKDPWDILTHYYRLIKRYPNVYIHYFRISTYIFRVIDHNMHMIELVIDQLPAF